MRLIDAVGSIDAVRIIATMTESLLGSEVTQLREAVRVLDSVLVFRRPLRLRHWAQSHRIWLRRQRLMRLLRRRTRKEWAMSRIRILLKYEVETDSDMDTLDDVSEMSDGSDDDITNVTNVIDVILNDEGPGDGRDVIDLTHDDVVVVGRNEYNI
jgi:hypothetical protein